MKKIGIFILVCIIIVASAYGLSLVNTDNNEKLEPNNNIEENIIDNNQINDEKENKTQAELILENMSLEEKVGQMFIVRCPETEAVSKISEYNIGGYILFGRDFKGKTKESITNIIKNYQNEANIPLLIGVDEEGGTVNRVSLYSQFRSKPFKSPQNL